MQSERGKPSQFKGIVVIIRLRGAALAGSSGAAASVIRCPAVWDSIHCWPPVEAGKLLTLPCREVFGRLNYTQHDLRWGADTGHSDVCRYVYLLCSLPLEPNALSPPVCGSFFVAC
ncbi:hypothetical protein HPB47_003106 [Ixodes persulcatus]|uniref:Uncharacterized protein n=1 Tax=Ixodes persulcatus TaxID=34615 RepID=A0AC60PJF2_IXOPE|nr:hypothetical protein HPB47_003106 [Ixodes persulcatus]